MWLDGSCAADCAINPRANRHPERRSYSSADDRPDCYTDRSPDSQAEAVWRGLGWWKAARSYLRDDGYLRDDNVFQVSWNCTAGR